LAPFWPVIDGNIYPGEVAAALKAGTGSKIDTMIGTTREEMAAFYCIDQDIAKADAAAIEGVFASVVAQEDAPGLTRPAAVCPDHVRSFSAACNRSLRWPHARRAFMKSNRMKSVTDIAATKCLSSRSMSAARPCDLRS
jgi:carboxylesterase type B